MARPLRRDIFAWFTALPSAGTLLGCLSLPQVRDCNGHVKTAVDSGTSSLLVVMALLALAPLAWRWPPLRRLVVLLAIIAGVIAVTSSLIILPVAIYCLVARPWNSTEQFVAFVCGCVALVFVVVFPLISLFSHWLYGATITWATGGVVMVSMFVWASAARHRAAVVPRMIDEPVLEPEPARPVITTQVALPPSPAEPLPAQIGDYTIEAELGTGGMARVYRARHRHLDTLHAIKVLDPSYRQMPEARQRFLDEARIQAKVLSHPNIVKVTNIVATPEHAALVMELVDGPSLESVIGTLAGRPDEIAWIMHGILAAVGAAHRAGVIHRDLKPANVLLEGIARIPRVTDFGIAKVTADSYVPSSSTGGGARMGTLPYMSPEQIRGAQDVTSRSDIFSLGIVLYEMATGELPFQGDSDYAVMDAIVRGHYILPRSLDPQLADVIRTALRVEPSARYASCAEMDAALTAGR